MLEIKRTGAAEYGTHMKVLLAGRPGAGKTLLASTFPNPFYACAEGGLMSVADRDIPFVDVKGSADLRELRNHLKQPPEVRAQSLGTPVDTIVIDTIDWLQKLLKEERKREKNLDNFDQASWGWLGDKLAGIVRGFNNLPLNVVFTSHLSESKDEKEGNIFIRPSLQGAMGNDIAQFFDLTLLLKAIPSTTVRNNETVRVTRRYLQTYPDSQYDWIKDRSGKLPAEFDVNFKDDYQRIYDLIYGTRKVPLRDSVSYQVEAVQQQPSTPEVAAAVVDAVQAKDPEVKEPTAESGPWACDRCGTTQQDKYGCNGTYDDPDQHALSLQATGESLCNFAFKEETTTNKVGATNG